MRKKKIIHRGLHYARTKKYREEKIFAKSWEKLANQWQTDESFVTQQEATAAATVIQWLGSSVGMSFLEDTLKEIGFELRKCQS